MSLLLSVNRLTKSFSGRVLFFDLQFGIESGDRIGLLGPNGVGKSTLLKILAKMEVADSGDVVAQRGLRLATLDQSPVFKPGQTILSEVLGNHELDGEDLARAYEWLARLELSTFPEDTEICKMSGGWQKRVALALALRKNPDLLLLDEPTNHLDVSSIVWLERFLVDQRITTFMITHDRVFLQRVATRILDLDPRFPGKILSVTGGYEKYLETKAQMISDQNSRELKLANTLRREKEWLARGAQARQTKQKARIQNAGILMDVVEDLQERNRPRNLDLEFGVTHKGPQKLIQAENLGKKSYTDHEAWLFRHLNLTLTVKSRMAILGPNGIGKSTLIRTFLGLEKIDEGKIYQAEKMDVGFFEQGRESLDLNKSVLKNLCPEGDYVTFQGSSLHVRSYLDRFRFDKLKADLPVRQLSGGEQARLRLAQLMLRECKILVLDEPTNDLDVETLDFLQEALQEFKGALILVTHDRYFMDQVADQILAFNPFAIGEGKLLSFADSEQWERWFDQEQENSRNPKTQPVLEKAEISSSNGKLSYKEKLEFEGMEKKIHDLEESLAGLQKESESAGVLSDANKLQEIYGQIGKKQFELEKLFSRWAELEAKSKKA